MNLVSAKVILSVVLTAGLVSCSLDNDMHYPKMKADFTAFEVEGQTSSRIDINARTVSVVLSESAYADKLTLKTVRYTENARCSDPELKEGKVIDLSSPKEVTLSTYQDYLWTISATQPVERYVKCEGQVGDATFHEDTRTISLTVRTDGDEYNDSRMRLQINDMKLELEGSRVISSTDVNGKVTEITSFPVVLDCLYKRMFKVESRGNVTEWSMIVLPQQ